MPSWVLIAYGIGLVGLIWFAVDSSRVPSLVWFWSGCSRFGWWVTVLVGFAAFGIPAFVVAVVWRWSPTRKGLYHEVDVMRGDSARRRAYLDRSTRSVA